MSCWCTITNVTCFLKPGKNIGNLHQQQVTLHVYGTNTSFEAETVSSVVTVAKYTLYVFVGSTVKDF